MKRFLVILAALAMVLPACETNEEIDKPCNHSWVDGVCRTCGEECQHLWENGACIICGETQTYTLSIKDAEKGAQIVMVNGNEVAEGEVIRVKHGEDLTFQLKNVISKLRTEVFFFKSFVDGAEVKTTRVKESENTYTIEGSYITGDVVVDAIARCNVALRLNGGSWIAETPAATVVDDVATLTDAYTVGTQFSFTLCLEKDGYYYAGVTDGTTTKHRGSHYEIAGDVELSVLWDAYIDATAMSAEGLGTAMRNLLASGETSITVNLPAEPTDEMYKAMRRALIETSEVEDGSIDLTIQGAKVVGEDAFGYHADGNNEYVSELRSITLTDATIIKDSAFYACENLISFSAPNVTEMENIVFVVCENLKDVYLPNLREMGHGAFRQCYALEKIALPELTTLRDSAFGACRDLKEVNLPKVSRVMDYALGECLSLERVTFGTPIVTLVDPFLRHGANESDKKYIADALRNTTLVLSAEQKEMVLVATNDHNLSEWVESYTSFPFGSSRTFIGYEFKSITAAE